MNTLTLQVPMDAAVKIKAQKVASEIGFSSLQDAVRLFLANLAAGKLSASFVAQTPDEILSPVQEKVLTRKYNQAMKEMVSGKMKTYDNVDDLVHDLHNGN